MRFEYFIAKRITFQSERSFSKLIVRLAVSAIALSIAVMLVSVAVVKGFQGEIKEKVTGFGAHIQIGNFDLNQTFENKPVSLPESTKAQIADLPQVTHIQQFAQKPAIIKVDDVIEGVVMKGVGSDFNWDYFDKYLVKGERLNITDSQTTDGIMLSRNLANRLKLDTGDAAVAYFVQEPSRVRKFEVKGIYNTGLEDVDEVFFLGDLKHVQKLNGWEQEQTGGYEVRVTGFEVMGPIARRIQTLIPTTQTAQTIDQLFPQIFDWLNLLDTNVQIILILMTIVAAINMITALLIMILERTQLIGLLKALGSRNFSVIKIFIYNAMILIGIGILIGNGLGFGFIVLQDAFGIVKLGESSYYLKEVPVYFEWGLFGLVNLGSFVFCSIMMLLPAAVVNSIVPVKSLRFE